MFKNPWYRRKSRGLKRVSTMRLLSFLLLSAIVLAAGSPAKAQEASYLGVRVADLTKEEAQELGWSTPGGAKLVLPVPGGPAAAAGLQAGDIIIALLVAERH